MTRIALAAAVLLACGGRIDVEAVDASADAKADVQKKDAGTKLDATSSTVLDPLCNVPTSAPSGGACITNVDCNPVTNAPCDGGAGEACDVGANGFQCYPAPPPNTAGLCESCDDNAVACKPGSTCVTMNQPSTCAKFCCDDGDCAGGHCDTQTLGLAPVGVCVK